MARKGELGDAIKEAARIAERIDVDDKYRPAILYFLLTKGAAPSSGGGTLPGPPILRGKPKRPDRASAPVAIRTLFEDEFFKEGKTIQEITRRLSDEGYHFGYETTKKALQRAEFLRAEGAKRNRRFYQRFPPS